MKITINSATLRNVFGLLGKVVPSKPSLPILENVLFHRNGNGEYLLTGTDTENTLSMRVDVEVVGYASPICLPIRTISSLLSVMPAQPITIEVASTMASAELFYSNGKTSFPVYMGDEYPAQDQGVIIEYTTDVSMNTSILQRSISLCAPFVTADELRPVMNGIYMHFTQNGVAFVASDGHRLIKDFTPIDGCTIDTGAIIPHKSSLILKLLFGNDSILTRVRFNDKSIVFSTDGYTLSCRQIDGRYPNYNAVIPYNNTVFWNVDKADLLGAIKRTSAMGSVTTGLVILESLPMEQTIKVSAQNIDFSTSASEDVKAECGTYSSVRIGLKAAFMKTILDSIDIPTIRIELTDPTKAIIVRPNSSDGDLTMLLMPMMTQ